MTVSVGDFDHWRDVARQLLAGAVPPERVTWLAADAAQSSLSFGLTLLPRKGSEASPPSLRVPRAFVELAERVACHRSDRKWPLLYRALWRLRHERHLLDIESDPDVHAVTMMGRQVTRDEHKMHAFVRFTPIDDEGGLRYIAWYQPDHLIVKRVAPFFVDRFAAMSWSILTPDRSVHWDGRELSFTAGVATYTRPDDANVERLWREYYASVFNPARVNLRATMREMPLRRWQSLPEATVIPSLVNRAHELTARAVATKAPSSARSFVPDTSRLGELREASKSCRGCRLHERATQTVFGEGAADATLMLVGEQPGDLEDLEGRPFVGPAGQVLEAALDAAGIDRRSLYRTNAVKHFSFEPRGKRRIHQTPRLSEMRACRPWLEAEIRALRPTVIVCLGSTAARALVGPQARVREMRGRLIEGLAWASRVVVTVHPSAVLRSQDEGVKYFEMLVDDLRLAASVDGRGVAVTSGGGAHDG